MKQVEREASEEFSVDQPVGFSDEMGLTVDDMMAAVSNGSGITVRLSSWPRYNTTYSDKHNAYLVPRYNRYRYVSAQTPCIYSLTHAHFYFPSLGASKGLGLAISQILLSHFKATVVAVSRSIPTELDALRSESNESTIEFVQGDVAQDSTSEKAVKLALEKYGRIDGLILNAGTIDPLGESVHLVPSYSLSICLELTL
jgi:hypothetical protein